MRRFALLLVPLIVAAMVVSIFVGLGSDDDDDGGSDGGAAGFPTVAGTYGDKPELTFAGDPAQALESQVLREGTGEPVAKGELLVADYLGQIWNGSVFDNSYDRGSPAGFQIGAGKVIPGWDETLVGAKRGSRMLLVVPPDKGYGPNGNPDAGISGTDTLVFVVDVIDAFAADASGEADAAPKDEPPAGVTVKGELGAAPTIRVAKGTAPPTKQRATVLAEGSGEPVGRGALVLQYAAVRWNGEALGSTWEQGAPVANPVGVSEQPNPFDALLDVPVGSRVLLEIPAQQGEKAREGSVAVVVDIVAAPPTAKEAAAA